MVNEAGLQLRQSTLLQTNREEQLRQLEQELRSLDTAWTRASAKLVSLQRLPSTENRDELRVLQRQTGYLDRQIEDLGEKARLIEMVDVISNKKMR